MKLLVLGGTGWLGGEVAAAAVSGGHDVTCVARGTRVPDGAANVAADRDEDGALLPLATERWDAVIDVAREPGHVRRAVRDLEPVAGHYLFVSSVSVYSEHESPGADESAERLQPLEADTMSGPEDYGPAKAACEDAVLAGFGPDRSCIIRPGLIAGPGDPTGRTDYWPWRFAHPAKPGIVLVPDAPELPTAVIDVRDLASWIVDCAERRTRGIFNAAGPAVPLPDHLEAAREAAASDATAATAPEDWLLANGVGQWAGPRSMPLWFADHSMYGTRTPSTARARAAGLSFRPLVETLRDSLGWLEGRGRGHDGAGLTDAEECDLLALLNGSKLAGPA
ncbi:NAD-dependent epimerase/dehydratase family protein [Sinomonas albida]|uniref:NAD-dependent epimerase/dehydratase family protein n=1 Tax=Sinomonas albida TaxID=369942 RepID=UPI0010A8FEB4|nr:NAD-dependent epimerase/dehydratase family protein [Sinomonas albida]